MAHISLNFSLKISLFQELWGKGNEKEASLSFQWAAESFFKTVQPKHNTLCLFICFLLECTDPLKSVFICNTWLLLEGLCSSSASVYTFLSFVPTHQTQCVNKPLLSERNLHIRGHTRAIKQIVILTLCVCVCVNAPYPWWGVYWSSSAPVSGCCCLCGKGLLLSLSLIGSIQTLSSLMGLFAALLWTQTHLGTPPGRWQEGYMETRPNPVVLRCPSISFGLTVCLYPFILRIKSTTDPNKWSFNTTAVKEINVHL